MVLILAIPVVTAVICFLVKSPKFVGYISLAGAVALASAALPVIISVISAPAEMIYGALYMDALSGYIMALVIFLSLVSAVYSIEYLEHEMKVGLIVESGVRRYYALLHLFIFTMLLVTVANNLALMWIAIEATTIVSALLIGLGFSALLQKSIAKPGEYLLPWKVASSPSGAKVRLPDGSLRETPFTIETTLFETVELVFEAPGYEQRHVSVTQPGDQLVHLSRMPESTWTQCGRVDALPLSLGGSHVLADRNGTVACFKGSKISWSKKLETLGGFARAAVPLPQRPGFVLLVSEDGEAWIVEAATGALEGPSSRNVAPLTGPYIVGPDVLLRFRDSTVWRWSTSAAPDPVGTELGNSALARFEGLGSDGEARLGLSLNFATLRRSSADKFHLDSPWNDLMLDVADGRCRLGRRGDAAAGFSVDLVGEWVYVAFESPSDAPHGRVWISDGRGLRSYLP